jgi:hypothetical protein
VHREIKIVSSVFSYYSVYLSRIAIPPIKKKNEKFPIKMFLNVPIDVIGA